jgi:hypothetical protein
LGSFHLARVQTLSLIHIAKVEPTLFTGRHISEGFFEPLLGAYSSVRAASTRFALLMGVSS